MNMHSIIHSRSLRGSLIAGSVAGVALVLAACGGAGSAKAPAAASAALATPTKAAAAAAVTKPMTETSAVTSTVKTEAGAAKTTAVTETKAMTEAAGAVKTAAMTETKATTETAAPAKTGAVTETGAMTTTHAATETAPAGTAAALVMLHDNGTHGKILTDEKGMALYVFDKDSMDKSSCTGDCLTKWPPLTVAAAADLKGGEGITGKLATIKREDDGKLQVTINGMPLYHYYEDKQPGDAKGQAVGDVWWLVGAEGNKISQ